MRKPLPAGDSSASVDWAITVNLAIIPLILLATAVSLGVKAQQPIFAILMLAPDPPKPFVNGLHSGAME